MSLQKYMEDEQTRLINEAKAFWAFGDKQFNEKKEEGVVYVSMGAGLICPKDTSRTLRDGLNKTYEAAIKKDIEINGKEKIIKRELYNYESFYTGDPSNAIEALSGYNFTQEEIMKIYYAEAAVQ